MGGALRKEKLYIQVLNKKQEQEHFHQDIELIYVLEGTMEVNMGEYKTCMNPEDVLVINTNKKHSLNASQDILFVRLSIAYQLVCDVFQSVNIIFWCDSTRGESERYAELRKVMKQLLNHWLGTKGGVNNFGHIALCYQVMDILSVSFLVQASDKENMDRKDKFEERILQINTYIHANYNQPISLKDLAEKLYLSNGYLSRFFKGNYGMSFADYLSGVRLYHSVDDLLHTNKPITRIAYDNGFASAAVFNKAFKETYGETPSAVRKKSKNKNVIAKKDENDILVEERLERFLRSDEIKKKRREINSHQDVFSVKESSDTIYGWNQMINVGAAEELLKSGVREHMILLKEALKFKYVRFWSIFSKELLIDISGQNKEYNFSKLDSILDFLVQHGMKPHIELGMKPKRIFKNVQHILFEDYYQVDKVDTETWVNVLDKLMKHLVKRYGRSELASWRMELWYDERKWDKDTADEEYYQLFQLTYEIIKQYSDEIEVGGCGLRIDYMEEAGLEFLKKWKLQPCQPDYLSIIYFAYERGEIDQDRYSKRSTDNEDMLHRLASANSIINKSGMGDVKIYVTEWNVTISDRNYINDTCFKGAYIVKNMLDVYGCAAEFSYYLGSDRISEYYDSSSMLHGGMGIITKDGILKPSGFAFEFLNRLYPYYIGKGDHYLITTDQHDSYGIMFHNQKALNFNYFFSKEDEIEKERIWKYYEDRDELALQMKLTDVEDGVYQLKTYRINEENGSVLNIWEEMQFEKELSRNDIKYFRRVCEPKLTIQKCETQNRSLTVDIQLSPNEIAFIRIRRLI